MAQTDTSFSNRRQKLAAQLPEQQVDAMLVTHLTHVRYLTGFSGSNGALLLSGDLFATMATDGRYTTQIAEEVPDIEAITGRAVGPALLATVEAPLRVGFEADYVSVSQLDKLKEETPEGIDLVPVTGVIEKIRLVKDAAELDGLTQVAQLASDALEACLDAGEVAIGRTERQVAADLEYRMRVAGAERVSFDTIVASGPNSAKPHHGAGDRVLASGDIVTIDYGAHVDGFNSDCTRTFVLGEVGEFAREIYELVLKSQEAGVKAAVPGASLVDVDAACRDIIKEAGYGEYFVHSTGHGIGLDVHEAPYAATTGSGELKPGMTLTIEPGVYVPGKGGVRIEDTLIITEGAPEVITTLPKQLRVL
ncbi:X-Pro dipeptidase [Corynebacterium phocae]|uniref:X-Pro dipeptidase n=1 Tax=Corynebacterium phocae TaxID=161895 RepID=A0A1L7D2T2_9CORY|nr:Xaa-Pro peptidase family protein [Corynebacterium phocae]APT92449.1 X-Pro dipeptidase [Corynebacterium phocae]KAA8725050.1 aminopeptidase P family protein [Corynebacterium phocae]